MPFVLPLITILVEAVVAAAAVKIVNKVIKDQQNNCKEVEYMPILIPILISAAEAAAEAAILAVAAIVLQKVFKQEKNDVFQEKEVHYYQKTCRYRFSDN